MIIISFQWAPLAASPATSLSSLLAYPQQEEPPAQAKPSARELYPQEPGDLYQVSIHLFLPQRPPAQVMGEDTLYAAS